MYTQGVFTYAPWYVIDPKWLAEFWLCFCRYQCLGNHDIVPGQPGVDFQTKVAPMYDDRWYFVSLITWSLDFVSFLMRSRELSNCRIIPTTSSAPTGQRLSSLSIQTASSPAIKKSSFPAQTIMLALTNTLRTLRYTATPTHQRATTTPKLKLTSCPLRSPPQTPPGNSSSYIIRIAQYQRMKQISPLWSKLLFNIRELW